MIENLPTKLTLDQLLAFNFGDIEANDDKLLFDSICKTTSIIELLIGDKTIIIGEKGTGKTALFRLLKDRKLEFVNRNGYKNLILAIDDNFLYRHIKSHVLKLISITIEERHFKYQVVWEIFIFFKIINFLKENNFELPPSLKKAFDLSNQIFGKNKEGGIFDLFRNSKTTFGFKLYNTPGDILLPDFYLKTEPTLESTPKEESIDRLEIDLDSFKAEISKLLKNSNVKLIILIDRLDEFVSKSDLKIQLDMLDALITVEREYHRFENIELKIFLRDDLFKQLSFEGIGYDKVISKKIDLIWTPEKIREFIARRIIFNFQNVLNLASLGITVKQEKLEIGSSAITENYHSPNFIIKLYRLAYKVLKPNHYAQKFPRKVNLTDEINKQVILTIFPKFIEHISTEGKKEDIEVFEYLATHFNLGTGNSIPRLFILFLNKLFEIIKEYYVQNFDSLPSLNNEKCYELIKHGFFSSAYKNFQTEVFKHFISLNREFEKKLNLLHNKKGQRYSFIAKELKGFIDFKNNDDLSIFCEYLVHIGYFKKTKDNIAVENQRFEIPILFRT
jgi:hypothetical protein